MNTIPFSSVQKNLSNGLFIEEDFLFLQNTWDTLSPGAQYSIFGISELSSEYMTNAINTANQGNSDFPLLWKEFTLQLIKKQIQNLEQEDKKNENQSILTSML